MAATIAGFTAAAAGSTCGSAAFASAGAGCGAAGASTFGAAGGGAGAASTTGEAKGGAGAVAAGGPNAGAGSGSLAARTGGCGGSGGTAAGVVSTGVVSVCTGCVRAAGLATGTGGWAGSGAIASLNSAESTPVPSNDGLASASWDAVGGALDRAASACFLPDCLALAFLPGLASGNGVVAAAKRGSGSFSCRRAFFASRTGSGAGPSGGVSSRRAASPASARVAPSTTRSEVEDPRSSPPRRFTARRIPAARALCRVTYRHRHSSPSSARPWQGSVLRSPDRSALAPRARQFRCRRRCP